MIQETSLIFDTLCFLCTYVLGRPDSVCPVQQPLTLLAWLICSSLVFLSNFSLCWHFHGCSPRANVTLSETGTMTFHKEIIEFSFPSALKFPWPFWLQHLTVLIFYFWNKTFHPGPVSRVFYFCHWCQTLRQDCWEPALAFPPPLFPFPCDFEVLLGPPRSPSDDPSLSFIPPSTHHRAHTTIMDQWPEPLTCSIPVVAKSPGWFFMYRLWPVLLFGFHASDLRAFVNTRFTSRVAFLLTIASGQRDTFPL